MSPAAVVTGAARGIGRAVARRLAADVDRLVLVDVSRGLADAVAEVRSLGVEATGIRVDLAGDEGVAAVEAACDGAVSVLVNNAGITRDARLVKMTDDDFTAVLAVNLGAAYRLTRALRGSLVDGASIVNVSSRSYLGAFGQFNYSMSKGALLGMTRALAAELAPRARCNAVAPGLIRTEMTSTIREDIRERMIDMIPMGRMGDPGEVAELVGFLASDRSAYVTGQVMVIGGGRSLR